jgi:hypothetical protein
MQDLPVTLMTVLHPGDLDLKSWLIILVVFGFMIVVPVLIVGFIIYKVATRK